MVFWDRIDAGNKLAKELKKYRDTNSVILAIPRGGLPIGYVISNELHLPLDILLSKKIGHPGHPEFAIGAVTLDNHIVDPAYAMHEEYLSREIPRLKQLLQDNYRKYRGDLPPVELANKNVIITDDGIATGRTILGTIEMMRHKKVNKVIIAVPVAPPESIRNIERFADEVVCLDTPPNFVGVGQFYEDFTQVSDEEAIAYLRKAEGNRAA